MALIDTCLLKLREYRHRRELRAKARLLIRTQIATPQVLRYIEYLEVKNDSMERELRSLRWEQVGQKLADLDDDLDRQEWLRRSGVDPQPFRLINTP